MTTLHSDPSDINTKLMPPTQPHVVVMFGATGDLARRKLLPGLLHLSQAGLVPECRIIGTSLDELSEEEFRSFARAACDEFATRPITDREWAAFDHTLGYVPQSAGPQGLADVVAGAELALGGAPRRPGASTTSACRRRPRRGS